MVGPDLVLLKLLGFPLLMIFVCFGDLLAADAMADFQFMVVVVET